MKIEPILVWFLKIQKNLFDPAVIGSNNI